MQRPLLAISILASSFVIAVSQWLSGLYTGVSYGASVACDQVFQILTESGTRIHITHTDPYFYLPEFHTVMSLSVLAYILIKSLERGKWLAGLAFAPLFVGFYMWYRTDKLIALDNHDPQKYLDAIKGTSGMAYTILGILIFILVCQIVSFVLYFRKPNNTVPAFDK